MICQDQNGDFVVIELKRNKDPDRVISQVDRYIEWVSRNLAQPNQRVRAVIIAQSINQHLQYILPRRPDIQVMLYDWQLRLKSLSE
jgi:RecB family endonuclease NucS